MKLPSIKKKVRGLRGKVKRIEKWRNRFINLDIEKLQKHGVDYVKLWIAPFYNLYRINNFECGHKNPPNWYSRLILRSMIDIYRSWEKSLKELGEPYYLKIWLYDPHFINSQIVAAVGDKIDYYTGLFEPDDNNRQFPYEKYKINGIDLTEFIWLLKKDQYIVYSSDFIDDEKYLQHIKKKAYKIRNEKILDTDETCYYVREGDVWIGSA